MSNLRKIDSLLRNQDFSTTHCPDNPVFNYAKGIAEIENGIVVVSDLKSGSSRIFFGEFAKRFDIESYHSEGSIWEKKILKLMDEHEREEKYLSEIRFFNFIKKLPKARRHRYCLLTVLRFHSTDGKLIDVAHRMYYQYDQCGSARYGICIYNPLLKWINSRCIVIDMLSGETIDLDPGCDKAILSRREKQVLQLIENGMTSNNIATALCISPYTVNRHRQEILSKLQVSNSTEACRIARQLNIL